MRRIVKMKTKKSPARKYVEQKKDSYDQFNDGLIDQKELEEQISWAYLEMSRSLETVE